MKIPFGLLLFVFLLKMGENRLENLLNLFPAEIRSIAKSIKENFGATLEKYLQPKTIEYKLKVEFNKNPLISDNDELINPKIVENLRENFDKAAIRYDLAEILSRKRTNGVVRRSLLRLRANSIRNWRKFSVVVLSNCNRNRYVSSFRNIFLDSRLDFRAKTMGQIRFGNRIERFFYRNK